MTSIVKNFAIDSTILVVFIGAVMFAIAIMGGYPLSRFTTMAIIATGTAGVVMELLLMYASIKQQVEINGLP